MSTIYIYMYIDISLFGWYSW